MAAFAFRLQTLLDQKIGIETTARAAVVENDLALQEEQVTLLRLVERENQVSRQVSRAREQRFVAAGTSFVADVQRRNDYLEALQQDLIEAHREMLVQKFAVEEAKARLEDARVRAVECTREVEKLNKYKQSLEKRFLSESARKEESEQDEIGTVMFLSRRNGL